jgi:hypothetical protein
MGEIEKILYRGPIERFRTFMEWLAEHHRGKWVSSAGVQLLFYRAKGVQMDPVEEGGEKCSMAGDIVPLPPPGTPYPPRDQLPPPIGADIIMPQSLQESWQILTPPLDQQQESHYFPISGAGIEAVERPDGKTLISFRDAYVCFSPPEQPSIAPIGVAFAEFAKMIITGMERVGGKLTRAAVKQRGGRPRNRDDQWAYEQVRVHGREPGDVYSEWLKRIGDDRKDKLADSRDSFNKAIRPRKPRGEETE